MTTPVRSAAESSVAVPSRRLTSAVLDAMIVTAAGIGLRRLRGRPCWEQLRELQPDVDELRRQHGRNQREFKQSLMDLFEARGIAPHPREAGRCWRPCLSGWPTRGSSPRECCGHPGGKVSTTVLPTSSCWTARTWVEYTVRSGRQGRGDGLGGSRQHRLLHPRRPEVHAQQQRQRHHHGKEQQAGAPSLVHMAQPPEIRGSAFGLLATVQAIGNVAASVLAGLLYTVASPTVAFVYLAVWMLIALATLWWAARTSAAA